MPWASAMSRIRLRLGEAADTVELETEDLGKAFSCDASRILQRHQSLVDADRRRRHLPDGSDVIQRLTRLLDGDTEIGDRVHDDRGLPPSRRGSRRRECVRPRSRCSFEMADALDVLLDVPTDLGGMYLVANVSIGLDDVQHIVGLAR